MRSLFAFVLSLPTAAQLVAADPLVFVSSFAAGDQGAIHAFRLHPESGALKPLGAYTEVEHPFFMALSPNRRFLYAIDTPSFGGAVNQIAAFALQGRSGRLKPLNRQPSHGRASCYLTTDATGRCLLVANYLTGDVGSLPVKKNGSLGRMESLFRHRGSSVDPRRQQAPFAHCIVVSPDNRFAFAADLGIDRIMSYRLEPLAGRITRNQPAFAELPPGSGPRHLIFHSNGKFAYVINELANTLSVFQYAADQGALRAIQHISTLPEGFKGRSHTADLKLTPDGRYLYGTNRGHDSIAAFRVGEDGRLSLIEIIPSRGQGPQNLAIAPDGRHLYCANMPGNNLATFRITDSGRLRPVGRPIELARPSCIVIAD